MVFVFSVAKPLAISTNSFIKLLRIPNCRNFWFICSSKEV